MNSSYEGYDSSNCNNIERGPVMEEEEKKKKKHKIYSDFLKY